MPASTKNVLLSPFILAIIQHLHFMIIMTALTTFRMIQRVVQTLPLKFEAMLSRQQIQKDISISMCALAMVFKCLEVPQVSPFRAVRCVFNL